MTASTPSSPCRCTVRASGRGASTRQNSSRGRRREDEGTRIGYTTSRAQHEGPDRTLCGPAEGQRRRRLQGHRTPAREDPTRRRRLHHGSDHERVRRNTRTRRCERSPCHKPVQNMLACQQVSTSAFQLFVEWDKVLVKLREYQRRAYPLRAGFRPRDLLTSSRRPKGGATWISSSKGATSR